MPDAYGAPTAKELLDGVESNPAETFAEIIVSFSEEYDRKIDERHEMGAKKYGAGKFLVVDTIQEALDEIVDLGNYARYTFIKLRLLQESIAAQLPPDIREASGFLKAGDVTSVKGL